MKTPTAKRGAVRIVVQPPHGRVLTASAPVSQAEAGQVVRAIRPRFAEYVAQYTFAARQDWTTFALEP